MTLDEAILAEAKTARETVLELERQQEHARVDFHHQIRRLHAAGGSLREIADELGLSHQRVHQIVGEEGPLAMRFPVPGMPGERVRGPRGRRGFFQRFTGTARDVVVAAQEEARLLGHASIGPEHILLGLLNGEGTPGVDALRQLGATLERTREAVEARAGIGEGQPRGKVPFTRDAKRVLELALRESLRLGDRHIGPDHVLLGLLRAKRGAAVEVLGALGVDLDAVRAAASGG